MRKETELNGVLLDREERKKKVATGGLDINEPTVNKLCCFT